MSHIPVLPKEVLEYLHPKSNENFIDCTVGQAGHTIEILKRTGPEGKVLGIDADSEQIANSKVQAREYSHRLALVNDSYVNITQIVERTQFEPVHGILLDLGWSSWQSEESKRGFSFQKDEVLDMRYDLQNPLTAQTIVNEYPEQDIKKILQVYGEEKFAKQIAKHIIAQREIHPIKSTFELKDIIAKAIPRFQKSTIHAATRTFQALRIAVNGELDNITRVLPDALSILSSGGRLVVISFHSLEDRIVKNFFKESAEKGIATIVTKKPVIGTAKEIQENPRSRSAKLRAVVKI